MKPRLSRVSGQTAWIAQTKASAELTYEGLSVSDFTDVVCKLKESDMSSPYSPYMRHRLNA